MVDSVEIDTVVVVDDFVRIVVVKYHCLVTFELSVALVVVVERNVVGLAACKLRMT